MNISVVVDAPDSWFVEHAKKLCKCLQRDGHNSVFITSLDEGRGDIAFLLSCRRIYSIDKLKLHKSNVVIHESDLPRGKGWSPVAWEVVKGNNVITLSLFEAVEKVDSGKIYMKDKIILNGDELLPEIREKVAAKTIEMALRYVRQYPMKGNEQVGEETFYRRRTPEDSELDINQSIAQQFNLMRIADNDKYPLFFRINNKKYILKIFKEQE